ncbi:hypothetical protein AYJ70_22150 [Pseudomonas monteilii]|uniref:Uncharacterized protein n=1 Tax=Pseudomonas monteilii TaxID=76759 RepID=A0AAP7KFW8_9PSED|nr:hypothetical protein AYJ70_22150 [Pseudomonas monteilii]
MLSGGKIKNLQTFFTNLISFIIFEPASRLVTPNTQDKDIPAHRILTSRQRYNSIPIHKIRSEATRLKRVLEVPTIVRIVWILFLI